jgi:L-aspartate oxidase
MPSILILGGGLAGLFLALKLSPTPCTVIAPKPLGQGASSAWAQGGVAAAILPGDSIESHVADTVAAGAGLVDEALVRGMAAEASDRILDLLSLGVPFDRDLEGKLVASREAAHSHARVVRVKGDMAGAKIMEALIAAVRAAPSITVIEGAEATSLIVEDGRVAGARLIRGGRRLAARADAVVLATGGVGHLYAVTTNPREANGQGLGMAALAGVAIRDPEFVQFHPTALAIGRDPAPLATEALRGEGATLLNREGRRFMLDIHPDGELAPRDVVARGVFAEIAAGRGAFLDCRAAIGAHFPEKFPTVHAACLAAGVDPARDLMPVSPAQHYHMGGVLTDARGRTTLPGLYAIGEVASTGMHGANRLASNSLLEAVVFGARVAEDLRGRGGSAISLLDEGAAAEEPGLAALAPIRRVMHDKVGVLRERGGLREAVRAVRAAQGEAKSDRLMNALVAAELIASAALLREESRGGHFRSDHPLSHANPAHTNCTLESARALATERLA